VEQERVTRRETGTQKSLPSEVLDSFEQRGTHHTWAMFALRWDIVPSGQLSGSCSEREGPVVPVGAARSQ